MSKLRVLDLFSGIGGFSLGLERTGGFETVAFCEIEPFPRKVLAKHWPKVPIYDDVRTLTKDILGRDGITVDVICGGFPCQDISTAGKGAGIGGERSGLWKEYSRLVGELRPSYVIVENVAALLGRGLATVCGDLAEIGYDTEWEIISAAAVGAPHKRERVWIVAHPSRIGYGQGREAGDVPEAHGRQDGPLRFIFGQSSAASETMAHPNAPRLHIGKLLTGICGEAEQEDGGQAAVLGSEAWRREDVADPQRFGPSGSGQPVSALDTEAGANGEAVEPINGRFADFWRVEPAVGRVANGVPGRVDRLKALGNAVVPQIPQLIGEAILQSMRAA